MGLRLQTVCDGCGVGHERGEFDLQIEARYGRPLSAREVARHVGWEYNERTGQDWCPLCVTLRGTVPAVC